MVRQMSLWFIFKANNVIEYYRLPLAAKTKLHLFLLFGFDFSEKKKEKGKKKPEEKNLYN